MSGYIWLLGSLWLYRLLINTDKGATGPKLPRKTYRKFFIAGLVDALVLVSFLYGLWHLVLESLAPDPLIVKAFYHFLVVGPVEELSKFFVFYLLISRKKTLVDPQSGMVQAGLTGLGFAVLENLYYIMSFSGSEYEVVYSLFRIFLVGPGHVIYAMIWGGYFALEVWEGNGRVRNWGHILLALFVPIFAHGLYNTLTRVHMVAALLSDLAFMALALVLLVNFRKISPFRGSGVSEGELVKALTLYPDSEELHRRLTYLHCRKESWEKGLLAGKAWALAFPQNPEPCFLASWCAWNLREQEKAIIHLQRWNNRPHIALEKYHRRLRVNFGEAGTDTGFLRWCREQLFGTVPSRGGLGFSKARRQDPAVRTRWDSRRGRTAEKI